MTPDLVDRWRRQAILPADLECGYSAGRFQREVVVFFID